VSAAHQKGDSRGPRAVVRSGIDRGRRGIGIDLLHVLLLDGDAKGFRLPRPKRDDFGFLRVDIAFMAGRKTPRSSVDD
jgi:hypothetical protein